jgi:hypothetical protein
MRVYVIAVCLLLSVASAGMARQVDPGRELRLRLRGTRWQWDGAGGEVIVFGDNGYIEHEGWACRDLITRWDVIDRRTVLLRIERGREQDLYSVLVFNEDMTSYGGFNFHGAARLKASTRLDRTTAKRAAHGPHTSRAYPNPP